MGADYYGKPLWEEGTEWESLKIHLQFKVMDPYHRRELIYGKRMPWVERRKCNASETGFWFHYFSSQNFTEKEMQTMLPPQTPTDQWRDVPPLQRQLPLPLSQENSAHWDPAGHPEEPGERNDRDTTAAWNCSLLQQFFFQHRMMPGRRETFQLPVCVRELKGTATAFTQLQSPPSSCLWIPAAVHIHQKWPICHLIGERQSSWDKPVQANIMSYLGTKHIFPSSAELQLQSLKSTAWAANGPCFTTASIILSVQVLATFSAVVELCTCSL